MSLKGKLLTFGIDISTKLDIAFPYGHVGFFGRLITVDTTEVRVLMLDRSEDVLMASGDTVPTDGESGYTKGCMFFDKDASVGSKVIYENVGTNLICDFNAIGLISTSDEITLADGKIIIGDAANLGAEYALSGDATMNRTGVVAISSDVIVNADVNTAAAIDATKIADGSVSSTEFQHLDGLDDNIQDQIDTIETLADGKIYMGDGVNFAEEVTPSGDATISNAGVIAIAADVIINADVKSDAAIVHTKLATGIDATWLADGTVSDTEFQYINSLTSNAQDQIDGVQSDLDTLSDGTILLGDVANDAQEVTMSGDVTMTNAGVTEIGAHAADVTVATDKKIIFRDVAIYVQSSVDGQLDVVADGAIELASTAIGLTANTVDVATAALGLISSGVADLEGTAIGIDASGALDIDAGTTLDIDAVTDLTISGGTVDITGTTVVGINTGAGGVISLDAGVNGIISHIGVIAVTQDTPTAKTVAVTLAAAELLNGIITATHTAGATQAYTLPNGTDMETALPATFAVDDSFDFTIINLSAALIDTVTLTAGSDFTIVGNPIISSAHTDSKWMSSGLYRVRKTATDTFEAYRLA